MIKGNFLAYAAANLAALQEKKSALDQVSAKRFALAIKPDLECLALAGLFGGLSKTQLLIESYFSKLLKSKKIQDFAVVNSTKASDLEQDNFKLDIIVKPNKAVNFIYLPMKVSRHGMVM